MQEAVTLVTLQDTGNVEGISKSTTGYIKITWWDGINQIFGSGKIQDKIKWSKAAAGGKQTFTIISCDETGNTSGNQTALDCRNNRLISLDASACTALYLLNCDSNSLTALDVNNLFALKYLHCSNNSLLMLDISGCTALIQLGCIGNSLTYLDASGFTSVSYLNCNLDEPLTQSVIKGEHLYHNSYELDMACVLNKLGGGYFLKLLGVQLEPRHMYTALPALDAAASPASHLFSNNALRSSLI